MFVDREEAGREIAELLRGRVGHDVLVLGLPRGGVPVAREVAHALGAQLDVLVVRKIGSPENPEFAMGAIATGVEAIDWDLVETMGHDRTEVEAIVRRERAELERRERLFRGARPFPRIQGREVVIIDDGIATGSTARAAARAVRAMGPSRLLLAAPVGTRSGAASLEPEVDELVVAETPPGLHAISQAYRHFPQVGDEEVIQMIAQDASRLASVEDVLIELRDVQLEGALLVPRNPRGLIVFAHGSGSGRNSPRNRYVAQRFHEAGYATLLADLLSSAEARQDEADSSLRFDIDRLTRRFEGVVDWVLSQPRWKGIPLALYGSSTGASAALRVAARKQGIIRAVVSRGGRVDLAVGHLGRVRAATLLIVGSADESVLAINQAAMEDLRGPKRLAIVTGAGHLFEEPGALDEVAQLAIGWLGVHLDHRVSTTH